MMVMQNSGAHAARILRRNTLALSLAGAAMLMPFGVGASQAQDKPLVVARDMDINSLIPGGRGATLARSI